MKKKYIAGLVLIIAIGIGFLARSPTEEERIGLVIQQAREGIEQEKLSSVMEVISEQYLDEDGFSQDAIKGLLLRQFLKNEPISISMSALQITVDEESAEVEFDAAAVDAEQGGIFTLPAEDDVLHFVVQLRQEDEEWRIVAHERQFRKLP